MSREGLALPTNFTLVKEDGLTKDMFLTFGMTVTVENARVKNPDVHWVIECVPDLVDFYHVGREEMPTETEFSNFLDQNRKEDDCADLIDMTSQCTHVLREAKFCGKCWSCAGGV